MSTTMRAETRTYLGETQREKASRLENQFTRLPEELFLSILTTVADLQSLFLCSLVSKHFAAAVFRVRHVCVTVLMIKPKSKKSFASLSTITKPKSLVFLEQFRELESISLEYKYTENSVDSSFTEWKVNFSTQFPKFDRLLGVLPAPAHEHISNEPFSEQADQQISTNGRWQDCFWSSLACYLEWLVVVLMLGQSHKSLAKVTFNDSEKVAKMVIGEEQLVKIRSFSEPQEIFQSLAGLEIAAIRWLGLPLSGYGRRWVILLNLNYTTEPYVRAIDDIVSWKFEDEEMVLVEAIKEIHKNEGYEVKNRRLYL